jgi:hypothetical protein
VAGLEGTVLVAGRLAPERIVCAICGSASRWGWVPEQKEAHSFQKKLIEPSHFVVLAILDAPH